MPAKKSARKVAVRATPKVVKHLQSGHTLDEYHTRLVMLFLLGVCFFLLAYTMLVVL
jgi:hypothetical protein